MPPLVRDLTALGAAPLDLLIIGGGVYGICAAWEAARRGLTVALVERGDFGEATSGNSLHTMHGGLRYLQQLDIRRMRESIRERRFWLRVAPDCVTPMPFVLPTSGHGLRGSEVMRTALLLNDIISADRNAGVELRARLPRGCLLAPTAAARHFGPLAMPAYNGAALWYDGFSDSPERMLIGLLRAASLAGARLANYCEVVELTSVDRRVCGAIVRDRLGQNALRLQARYVLNATGPWVDAIAKMAGRQSSELLFCPSRAMNLVVPRLPLHAAIGVPALRKRGLNDSPLDKGTLTYFIMPWGEYSLIGSKHLHCTDSIDEQRPSAREVGEFLAELNPVLGEHRLTLQDVITVKHGLLPRQVGSPIVGDVVLQKHARLVDHEREDGIAGLLSIVGVKWTTARLVAEQAVGMVCDKLGHPQQVLVRPATLHTGYEPTGPGEPLVAGSRVTLGNISAAAKTEMAVHLTDVVMRRTPLWLDTALDRSAVVKVAQVMAGVLGWSPGVIERQVEAVLEAVANRNAWRGI